VSDVRWDSGVRQGDSISPYYDSMIAKLIVYADTREQALTRLDVALAQLHIVGVQNNVAFVRRVIRTDSFAKAHLDTALIEREKAALFHQQMLSAPQSIAAVVAALLRTETTEHTGWTDPWSVRQSWLMQGRSLRSFHFEMHGEKHTAALTSLVRGGMRLHIDGNEAAFSWRDVAGQLQVTWGEQHFRCHVYADASHWHVFTDAGEASLHLSDPLAHLTQDAAIGGNLAAPMPGKLLSFAVKVGEQVQAGQALAVMEAMKMEHTVAAPASGTVAELLYAPGDQVAEGAPLLRLSTD
jgi:3-methylcrotonyl-CoA carboxylase alpha subunit